MSAKSETPRTADEWAQMAILAELNGFDISAESHRMLASTMRELAQAMAELATMTERYNVAAMNALDATAELAKVAAARGQAEAENKALREDAERYRVLRSSDTDVSVLAELIRNARSENRFDAAIDQARKK